MSSDTGKELLWSFTQTLELVARMAVAGASEAAPHESIFSDIALQSRRTEAVVRSRWLRLRAVMNWLKIWSPVKRRMERLKDCSETVAMNKLKQVLLLTRGYIRLLDYFYAAVRIAKVEDDSEWIPRIPKQIVIRDLALCDSDLIHTRDDAGIKRLIRDKKALLSELSAGIERLASEGEATPIGKLSAMLLTPRKTESSASSVSEEVVPRKEPQLQGPETLSIVADVLDTRDSGTIPRAERTSATACTGPRLDRSPLSRSDATSASGTVVRNNSSIKACDTSPGSLAASSSLLRNGWDSSTSDRRILMPGSTTPSLETSISHVAGVSTNRAVAKEKTKATLPRESSVASGPLYTEPSSKVCANNSIVVMPQMPRASQSGNITNTAVVPRIEMPSINRHSSSFMAEDKVKEYPWRKAASATVSGPKIQNATNHKTPTNVGHSRPIPLQPDTSDALCSTPGMSLWTTLPSGGILDPIDGRIAPDPGPNMANQKEERLPADNGSTIDVSHARKESEVPRNQVQSIQLGRHTITPKEPLERKAAEEVLPTQVGDLAKSIGSAECRQQDTLSPLKSWPKHDIIEIDSDGDTVAATASSTSRAVIAASKTSMSIQELMDICSNPEPSHDTIVIDSDDEDQSLQKEAKVSFQIPRLHSRKRRNHELFGELTESSDDSDNDVVVVSVPGDAVVKSTLVLSTQNASLSPRPPPAKRLKVGKKETASEVNWKAKAAATEVQDSRRRSSISTDHSSRRQSSPPFSKQARPQAQLAQQQSSKSWSDLCIPRKKGKVG